MGVSVARVIAYDAFMMALENKQNPDEAVTYLIEKEGKEVNARDRRFIKEILYGGLRWYFKIFWILQKTSKRDLKLSSSEVRVSLILGAYQIFYMSRVPDRAAVNESVEYVRLKGNSKSVKFVNGMLRSIARRSEYYSKPDKDKFPTEYLSLQFSHPKWIVSGWINRFNFEKTKSILSSNNMNPPCAIRINTFKVTQETLPEFRKSLLREEKIHSERKSLRSCLYLNPSPNLGQGSLFQKGFYSIQDQASQLVVNLMDIAPGEVVFDACCGKGGKTGHIYEKTSGKSEIYAMDKSSFQLSKAKENMQRLGHSDVKWLEKDFLDCECYVSPDHILVDAPCSGLGVLRRHPEGKWTKSAELIPKMAAYQKKLLKKAIELIKPGGEIVFSVCSFEEQEGIKHLEWLEEDHKDISVVSPLGRIPNYYNKYITRDKVLLIYSGNEDLMDGFTAFILKKNEYKPA